MSFRFLVQSGELLTLQPKQFSQASEADPLLKLHPDHLVAGDFLLRQSWKRREFSDQWAVVGLSRLTLPDAQGQHRRSDRQ